MSERRVNAAQDAVIKVLVLGDAATGKTSIIKRYVHDAFSEHHRTTIGVDFALKAVTVSGTTWKKEIDSKVELPNGKTLPVILCGNKCDLKEDVDREFLDEFCNTNNFTGWFDTSAKENIHIDDAAKALVTAFSNTRTFSSGNQRADRKGNKLVAKINRRLQELNRGAKGAAGRARRTQINKLSADFKNQVRVFEETCERLLDSERQSVEFIRRSSQSFKGGDGRQTRGGAEFTNYSEDQIYAQANVIVYDEDDLQRREEDIIQINHQLREVNAAFQEIDGLVQDQGEMVVEIVENTDTAKDNVEKALEQVKQAEERRNCCACSKMKLICIAIFALLVFIALMGIIFAAK
ncbi:Peptidyl-prolyl cis-trans isomerase CPR6 [Phytophthora nicotianae]|uniref:Peptidyl-prolyl cis-trans isomerase CPR6 n=1 Tax=Phytophthora nicotianae TaxID=4792 RepID=A0A0W8D510_PHYNI|nr:Peptidyl-prolyl cis-trans isomerase CPR6 [Phytophthora nicotianae]